MKNKGFANILLIILGLLVIGGGFYYFTINSNQDGKVGGELTNEEKTAISKQVSINSFIANIRSVAGQRGIYGKENTYVNLCSNGTLNTFYPDIKSIVDGIMQVQGVNSMNESGITCVSSKDKFVVSVDLSASLIYNDINSICADSSGSFGDNLEYIMDEKNVSCVLVN